MIKQPDLLSARLTALDDAARQERDAILHWWMENMADDAGGFYGEIDWQNNINKDACKGLVLFSRILWTFSAAYEADPRPEYIQMAERAYRNLIGLFEDKEYGGLFWSVDATGEPLQDKKQVYGLAFAIYGLSEYSRVTGFTEPGDKAVRLFELIEKYSRDPVAGGYFEAFTRDWQLLDDLRLSEKDANEKKTMNTHLHVLEAYTNLYRVRKPDALAEAIRSLLQLFRNHIINPLTYTQGLFFTEDWKLKSSIVSFGHDIEASWLLYEAAEVLGEKIWIDFYRLNAVQMAEASKRGLDEDGGLFYELDQAAGHMFREKHWWPQAEAMVGFLNAFQLGGGEQYLGDAESSWQYITRYIKDQENGEWNWGRDEQGRIMQKEKAGFWKCPYHNVRACLEISKRVSAMLT